MLEVTPIPSPPFCACYWYSCVYDQLILRLDRVMDSPLPLLLQFQWYMQLIFTRVFIILHSQMQYSLQHGVGNIKNRLCWERLIWISQSLLWGVGLHQAHRLLWSLNNHLPRMEDCITFWPSISVILTLPFLLKELCKTSNSMVKADTNYHPKKRMTDAEDRCTFSI